jgi:DNA polymerase III alpha subunit
MSNNTSKDFIHLHMHSEFSALDGVPKVEEYVMKALEMNMPALALTEHGNLRSMYQLYIKCTLPFDYKGQKQQAAGIKPIFGIEFYVTPSAYDRKGLTDSEKNNLKREVKDSKEFKERLKQLESSLGLRKRFHILAFAKNKQGLENLFQLNFMAWKDGYYYRPRIDLNLLKKYHEGLIITTSCIGGWAPSLAVEGKDDEAYQWLMNMKKLFKDDIYIELQPHDIKEQVTANQKMLDLAQSTGIKVIATNDCHYLNKEDSQSHEVLLAIQSNQTMQSQDRWRFEGNEFYMKSKDEMIQTFSQYHNYISPNKIKLALENTMEIYEKCDVKLEIDRKKGILPNVYIPEEFGDSAKRYLISLCKKGWTWRKMSERISRYAKANGITEQKALKIYKDRLEFELQRIFKLRFEKYFLLIQDLINWARSVDIMVGPGRGSSSASIVCFLTGITSIDPIEYDLLFDRFLSEGRIDYPDVDMDYEDSRRKEIFKYLIRKYGEENVCQIGTVGRMKGKQALNDVARVFGIPIWETRQVTKHIIERSGGDARSSQTVEDSFKEFDVCKEYNQKYPHILPHVLKLEGKARQCLSGRVKIKTKHYSYPTIGHLYSKLRKDTKIKVWNGTEFVFKRIKEVIYQGKKLTVRITAESSFTGKRYILDGVTYDHLLLKKDGWDELENIIKSGEMVAVNGISKEKGRDGKGQFKKGFTPWNKGKKGEQVAWNKGMKRSDHPSVKIQADKMIGNDNWKLRNDIKEESEWVLGNRLLRAGREYICENCGISKDLQVDHKVSRSEGGDHKIDNLRFLCKPCHNTRHGRYMTVDWAKIISVEEIGVEDVYDISIDTENENEMNFIADGFIVHNCGVHAAGVQVSPSDISKIVPIEYRETPAQDGTKERIKVAGLDWMECQGLGLIKLDVLGLRTLGIIKAALNKIKERHGIDIDLESISLEDPKVLQGFTDTRFVGIFQFDSIGMTKTCEKLTFTCFNDVISLNALYRPGAMRSGLATHYINRKIGTEEIEKLHPTYDKITAETYGVLVYQEQLIKCFVEMANYEPATADELRKKVAKSQGVEIIGKESDKFVAGAVANGLNEKKARDLFENMAFFGSYAFNKAHSAAYSVISYWNMYLKIYYPTEFFYALMKLEKENEEILRYVVEARKMGIEVRMPDVNNSDKQFSIVEDKVIICGLCDIKGCGEIASEIIVASQPFRSMREFCEKVNRSKVNKGVIKSLVKAGAFGSIYPNMGALLVETEIEGRKGVKPVWEWMIDMDEDTGNWLYNYYDTPQFQLEEEQLVKVMGEVCPIPPFKHKIEYYEIVDKYVKGINKVAYIDFEALRTKVKGTLVDIKYNNVGDFHKEEPDEKEKKRIGWGKRYANVNVEDETGIQRINIDIDTFPSFRHIIDKGLNTPVLISGRTFAQSEVMFADIMVDLDEFREILERKDLDIKGKFKAMNPFQRYFLQHPAKLVNKQANSIVPLSSISGTPRVGCFKVCGLILRIKFHWTKKDKRMAFIDIEDDTGCMNVICWPEGLNKYRKELVQGNVISMFVKKDKDGCFIDDRRIVKVERKAWSLLGHIDVSPTREKTDEERMRTGTSKVNAKKYLKNK